jgi:hypothetical protein
MGSRQVVFRCSALGVAGRLLLGLALVLGYLAFLGA